MSSHHSLNRLRDDLSPDDERRQRVRMLMDARIGKSDILARAKEEANPTKKQKETVWNTIHDHIDVPAVSGVLGSLKDFFEPKSSQKLLLRDRILMRLTPVPAHYSYIWTKRIAAFALVLMALKVSPALFLAPSTIAESTVLLVPTRGHVEIALHDLWQSASSEVTLSEAVQLRTEEGEATVILHDDGTLRMDEGTTISLNDLSDRPEVANATDTFTLTAGRVWAQGLLPNQLRGIVIATPFGDVMVHGGSVSMLIDENNLTVRVWDRHAVITQGDVTKTLVAGERIRLGTNTMGEVTRIEETEYDEKWVVQNLQRDAVHQREIAQMQQERRAAQAGILPTSPLYPVKRVAERVDVLLTLDAQTKIQKQIDQASTRLNEAAALIAEGETGASVPLQEYKDTLLAVGSGDILTNTLLRKEVAENTATLSAALPDEEGYQLKRVVLETSAELDVSNVDESDVQGALLVDTLDVLKEAIEQGDTERAEETYKAIEPHLSSLDEEGLLKPEVKKEALTLLTNAAERLEQSETGAVTASLEASLKPFLPPKPAVPEVQPLTEEQVDIIVEKIRQRIFTYSQPRARWNQLQYEMTQLMDHPDAGRIFRRLYHALPENGLATYVRTGIQELRENKE